MQNFRSCGNMRCLVVGIAFFAFFNGSHYFVAYGEEADGQEVVRIERMENRTKASIAGKGASSEDKPNIINRGVRFVAHGTYYGLKAVASGVGKGIDFTVDAFRKSGRMVYDVVTPDSFKKKKTT